AVVASGNIPGAALPSVVQARLLKSPCIVRASSAEPVLLPLYARSLAEVSPLLGSSLAVTTWPGGDREREAALLAEVEALLAYGSDETLRSLRELLPVRARFVGYGHRISFSVIAREWLSSDRAAVAARLAARDLCLFDQQGCLSPQAIYLEHGGEVTPDGFAGLLAAELTRAEEEWPRRELDAAEAAAIHQYRASVEMRSLASPDASLWTSPGGTGWTVALVGGGALAPCCLNRTAVLQPLGDIAELPTLVGVQRPALMSVAIGAPRQRYQRLAGLLAQTGVTRIAPLGHAQLPEDPLYHDGVNGMAALVRFVTIEAGEDAGG
ncbi:MAG TPA: acyl-CoA reductase, partial [Armatimonadota bacterium]|nr:acyl-CoA reductase [Armatimonadota bacterium]